MYKLWNYLFGWDYIHWRNTADSGIAKVLVDGEGNPYYYRYKITNVVDQLPAAQGQRIIWLTCKPEKYLPKESE